MSCVFSYAALLTSALPIVCGGEWLSQVSKQIKFVLLDDGDCVLSTFGTTRTPHVEPSTECKTDVQ